MDRLALSSRPDAVEMSNPENDEGRGNDKDLTSNDPLVTPPAAPHGRSVSDSASAAHWTDRPMLGRSCRPSAGAWKGLSCSRRPGVRRTAAEGASHRLKPSPSDAEPARIDVVQSAALRPVRARSPASPHATLRTSADATERCLLPRVGCCRGADEADSRGDERMRFTLANLSVTPDILAGAACGAAPSERRWPSWHPQPRSPASWTLGARAVSSFRALGRVLLAWRGRRG